MEDFKPKTAFEIAMERLQKRDVEEGVKERPLTDAQRAAIAEIRSFYKAKLAERDVLYQSEMKRIPDPEVRLKLEDDYRHDRERFENECEAKVERARTEQDSHHD